MFKQANCEQELYQTMEQQLVSRQADQSTYGLQRLAQAAQYLDQAASIFEKAGMPEFAEEITQALQSLTQELTNQ
jgi:hypothetical protein